MTRPCASLALVFALPLLANADPTPVERAIGVQKAMATARGYLDVNMPAEAVAALEAEINNADGNKAFLTLLREAYLAELYRLEKADTPDAARLSQIRRSLALLGGVAPKAPGPAPAAAAPVAPAVPVAVPTLPAPTSDSPIDAAHEAAAAFKKGDYAAAARLFASVRELNADQKTAWAYCRVRLANESLNAPSCDGTSAAACAADVTDALKLLAPNAELRPVAEQVIAMANRKAGSAKPTPVASGDVVETPSFRVRHSGNRELAEAVAKAAEEQRGKIFERWSGPPAGAWNPKCEITIHATADAFTKATARPAGGTGNAAVQLVDGLVTERRIDLRADDPVVVSNALPRELTHVVLADLFPDKPAPRWAVEGMAILAGTPEEVARYTRTLPRCARDGDWHALAKLLEMKGFPADNITGFYCQSVSLTEYLVRAGGGEKHFTTFLRDCQRYGAPQALRRQYEIDGPQALEAAWKRAVLETGRAQSP